MSEARTFALAAAGIIADVAARHARFQRDLCFYIWRWPLDDELQQVMRRAVGINPISPHEAHHVQP